MNLGQHEIITERSQPKPTADPEQLQRLRAELARLRAEQSANAVTLLTQHQQPTDSSDSPGFTLIAADQSQALQAEISNLENQIKLLTTKEKV
jgi:hypothetical protein